MRIDIRRAKLRKHVISYSGGVCSFWALSRAIAEYGKDQCVALFADTLIEDKDLYRFNKDVEANLGIKIVVIADGRTPWEVFRDNRMIANHRADICSRVLKRDLLWKWIRKHHDHRNTTIHLGLDWTEEHRLKSTREARVGWTIEAPMMHEPIWDKPKMLSELTKIGIKIPRLYEMGFPHNNCGGFCVKAGMAHFAHLLNKMPERYAYHESKEKEIREQIGKDVSILKDRRGGPGKPLTLETLRGWIESGTEFDKFDWGGCGCAVDSMPRLKRKSNS